MYLTPSELKAKHPAITWPAQDMGYLLKLGLVSGKKRARTCYLNEAEVLALHEAKVAATAQK